MHRFLWPIALFGFYVGVTAAADYDVLIRNGIIYDGSGKAPFKGDVAVKGDTIAAVGQLRGARGKTELDGKGLAVAPGFINMLSWATESLIEDGRSQSDIRQRSAMQVQVSVLTIDTNSIWHSCFLRSVGWTHTSTCPSPVEPQSILGSSSFPFGGVAPLPQIGRA